jgi:GxxExxY protein
MEQGETDKRRWEGFTETIIGACIEVHRHLGPGLLESAYEHCLAHELTLRRLRIQRQVPLPLRYKGLALDCGYRLDIVVEGCVVLELKTVDRFLPVHEAQLITYLKLMHLPVGLLVNFNVPFLKQGLRRLVNRTLDPSQLASSLPPFLPVNPSDPSEPPP